jgi:hypothetical protein
MGTMIVRRFLAKTTGAADAKPPSTNFCGFVVSAERKTSAGAPCSICVSRADDESVENVIVVPGCAVSYAVLALSRAPLSDAAPRIWSSTGWAVALCADPAEVGPLVGKQAPPQSLQAATRNAVRNATAIGTTTA